MTTFTPPRNPDFPLDPKFQPRVLKEPMGDGFVQRIKDGINSNLCQQLSLTWTNITAAEATTLNDFFNTQAGYLAFSYQPPHIAFPASRKWICGSWNPRLTDAGAYTFTAEFEEVPDP